MVSLGALLILTGIYVNLQKPSWVLNANTAWAAFMGAGIAALLITALKKYQKKKPGNIEDERSYRIAEKSAYRTFQLFFPILGFLFAGVSITKFSPEAEPILSLLFGFTGVTYAVAFFYYRRKI
ncbi:MAG: DUF2178 domain-containing protein [Candidatus Nanohaloarchaeota archaeon QJJ-9]|nr:DUF2178 domain-containing protein [Candidatus Nanohaloarchaeota archaeon QJJ-9]